MTAIDIRQDVATSPASNPPLGLKILVLLGEDLVNAEKLIETLEGQLKDAKARREELATSTLPDAMAASGLEKFTVKGGSEIIIKKIVSGSIPKDKRGPAMAWLKKNKYGHLIKQEVSFAIPRGKDSVKLGKTIAATLKKLGVKVETEEAVHHKTLSTWAREQIEEGVKLPLDILGLFVGSRAHVNKPSA